MPKHFRICLNPAVFKRPSPTPKDAADAAKVRSVGFRRASRQLAIRFRRGYCLGDSKAINGKLSGNETDYQRSSETATTLHNRCYTNDLQRHTVDIDTEMKRTTIQI